MMVMNDNDLGIARSF